MYQTAQSQELYDGSFWDVPRISCMAVVSSIDCLEQALAGFMQVRRCQGSLLSLHPPRQGMGEGSLRGGQKQFVEHIRRKIIRLVPEVLYSKLFPCTCTYLWLAEPYIRQTTRVRVFVQCNLLALCLSENSLQKIN